MALFEPPPQINIFNWIWQKWLNGFWQRFEDLASTDTDDGTKGFHLVSWPPLPHETSPVNYEYNYNDIYRFIPKNLHAGIRAATNTTALTTYCQNAIDSCSKFGSSTDNSASGMPLRVHAGKYLQDGVLKLYAGLTASNGRSHIIGDGTSSTSFEWEDGSNCDLFQLQGVHSPSGESFHHHSVVEKIHIDGNKANQTNPTATITNITQANPAVVTAVSHNFDDGDLITITSVSGMTEVNNNHYIVDNSTTNTFELESTDSSGYTAYSSGGTATKYFKGFNCYRAATGFVLRDVKINDVAGDAIYYKETSNPYMENVNIVRAGRHGIHITGGNTDTININSMEIADCTTSGMFINNITGSGVGTIVATNLRFESDQVAMTDHIRSEKANGVSIVLVEPKFHVSTGAPAGTYNAIRIENTTQPRITMLGHGFKNIDNLFNDGIDSITIGTSADQPVIFYGHAPHTFVTNSTDESAAYQVSGESNPRLQLTPLGPVWGSGSGANDIRIQRDSADQLKIADTSSNERDLRMRNTINTGIIRHSNTNAIADGDATPDVSAGTVFETANTTGTTITDFDGGTLNQQIIIYIEDANTNIDFTGSGLKGNVGVDWSPTTGDHMTCVYDGTDWRCLVSDNTA